MMTRPTLAVVVKFRSNLPFEEIQAVVNSRIDEFRSIPGLTQKYYVQDPKTGEVAGMYFWRSTEDFAEFRESELRATIAKAYKVDGEPSVDVYNVFDVLRDGPF